jgi:hypothetical protein
MSPFDFFKKSDKKKNAKSIPSDASDEQGKRPQSETDNPFSSPELNKKRYEAATEFLQFFQEKTPLVNGRPHAGTVLSIGARLAGTSLYRAINKKDVEPGVAVLSEEVNRAYPQLLNMFAYYCKQSGIDVMAKPLVTEFPEGDKPRMELSEIQTEYQKSYNLIMKKHGLDDLESARAGMVVCSMFFNYHCMKNKDIDPYVATGIVAMGVVEGAKTSPVPLNSEGATAKPTKDQKDNQVAGLLQTIASSSINGSGMRLIVGRGMAPMEEAKANGGKYLLANPGVLIKLEEGNIDPFLVYETALHMELASKISQIDIVNTNVDELVREWSGKPQDKAPNYVRQVLWLEENAEKYGYQRNGNSWKLKQ